ncbi:hypothetical protein GCM10025865_14950 [Paraoerskovia sediminicola]|uniref:SGNH hydrolase-type esterase domain-containing protein n=1 Tax=Paraoerskovia sediminicola TaxID=1138587 RepID=A0ABN6XF12_9CELL|nr:SGNH/GDSL hydrolase family protein [Paraoerskovia sediminicola]BDZ42196.1 hypothetical protein GCM10025865_14950 [Paraoerskovia sediminicola]
MTREYPELLHALTAAWPDNRALNVVWHGHSVPAGYHRTPDVRPFESYPHLVHRGLAERFPTAVLNSITTAVGGEHSVRGAERFDRDVLPHRPDLLFIDYAINDRALPLAAVGRAWRSMVRSAQRTNTPLVLVTPTGVSGCDLADPSDTLATRAALIRSLGTEFDVPVADVSAAWRRALARGVDESSLLSQENHPNARGHSVAAEEMLHVLDRAVVSSM